MNGAAVSVKADGDRGEDRRAVPVGMAVERFLDMLEAGLDCDPAAGQQSELRRVPGKTFERGEAVDRGELADGVHPSVKVERREARSALAGLRNAQRHFASQ